MMQLRLHENPRAIAKLLTLEEPGMSALLSNPSETSAIHFIVTLIVPELLVRVRR